MALLLLLLSLLTVQLSQASSGSFTLLTFNVAGLPTCLNRNGISGSKAANARLIGRTISTGDFTIVQLQEDFNYHAALYSSAILPYRTSTSGGVPFGSGLNTLSWYPWTQFKRNKWKDCHFNEGDCLTPKGFTYMRMRIAKDVEVDLYNLHADAGDKAGDVRARKSNFAQMQKWMETLSAGYAMIVAGDFNERYTSTDGSLKALVRDVGLRDAWVELVNGGIEPARGAATRGCSNPASTRYCETVDKVLYRGSEKVQLRAQHFEYAARSFLQPNGRPVSDHNPIVVRMSWESV